MNKSKSPARRDSGRVLEHILDDGGERLASATPAQLAQIADLDLWRSRRPGVDEQFDADRFGEWLEVLAALGEEIAAKKLTEMVAEVVIAGLAQHIRVFDVAQVIPHRTTDGTEMMANTDTSSYSECEVGGYRLVARRTDSWEVIVAILIALDTDHSTHFHELMRGCRTLSDAGRERDELVELLDDDEQHLFDLAVAREARLEEQGYVSAAQARAFLERARRTSRQAEGSDPRSLVVTSQGPLSDMKAYMRAAFEQDPAVYARRTEELTYLANTLMAGCSVQGRGFTPREAWMAAVATCNLGLQNSGSSSKDLLLSHDLSVVFQLGWSLLYKEIVMYTAQRLLEATSVIRCSDAHIRSDLNALRADLSSACRAGTPWRARRSCDVIAVLDMPAHAAVLALLEECPVMHAVVRAWQNRQTRRISATDFEFISENSQIALIREFVQSLPETLCA